MEVPSRFEVDDALRAELEPLIPPRERRFRHPGRKAVPARLVLNGILHVLHTGIAWRDLPQEYGYGSGVTCWRRLRDWQQAGVWDALHQRLLTKLNAAGAIDWSHASVDGSHVRAFFGGGLLTGPSPARSFRSLTSAWTPTLPARRPRRLRPRRRTCAERLSRSFQESPRTVDSKER